MNKSLFDHEGDGDVVVAAQKARAIKKQSVFAGAMIEAAAEAPANVASPGSY